MSSAKSLVNVEFTETDLYIHRVTRVSVNRLTTKGHMYIVFN